MRMVATFSIPANGRSLFLHKAVQADAQPSLGVNVYRRGRRDDGTASGNLRNVLGICLQPQVVIINSHSSSCFLNQKKENVLTTEKLYCYVFIKITVTLVRPYPELVNGVMLRMHHSKQTV